MGDESERLETEAWGHEADEWVEDKGGEMSEDKLNREEWNTLSENELRVEFGNICTNLPPHLKYSPIIKQVVRQIKSLLTPASKDTLDEFVWYWIFKEIDFDYDDLIEMLKEYDALKGEGGGK